MNQELEFSQLLQDEIGSFNNELFEEIKNLGGRSNSKISTQQNYL